MCSEGPFLWAMPQGLRRNGLGYSGFFSYFGDVQGVD